MQNYGRRGRTPKQMSYVSAAAGHNFTQLHAYYSKQSL